MLYVYNTEENIEIVVHHLNGPPNNKHKRIIWMGVRSRDPRMTDCIYGHSNTVLSKEILSVGSFPILLVWQTDSGEKKYASVTVDRRSKEIN